MPIYHFLLKPTGNRTLIDRDGEEFPDEKAAYAHAAEVAREIMRHGEVKCRAYRLQVCDENLDQRFEILFASIDETLDHLTVDLRQRVEEAARSTASLNDAVAQVKMTLSSVTETLAEAGEILSSVRQGR